MKNKAEWELLVVSFLALFFEMFLIRFIPSQVRIIGYFTNVVLIASFLGLGVGCLLARHKIRLLNYFPFIFFILLLLVTIFRDAIITGSSREILFINYNKASFSLQSYYCLALFYILTALSLVPLGQELGKLMLQIPQLKAYSINIAGSIFGVLIFSVFSLLCLAPSLWLILCLPLLAWLYREKVVLVIAEGLVLICAFAVVHCTTRESLWSPYHKITISQIKYGPGPTGEVNLHPVNFRASDRPLPLDVGFNINVNNNFYQVPIDLSAGAIKKFPFLKLYDKQYNIPYTFGGRDDILIVGGGSGNDAASALRNNAKSIDVVDIEPLIVKIGRAKHPEHPYSSPRVHVYIDDARSFFHKTKKKYDLIIFGLLDSQIIFSSLSNNRLDSYVYTIESFKEVKKLLKKDGLLVLTMSNLKPWAAERLILMVRKTFKSEPYLQSIGIFGFNLIAGEGLDKYVPNRDIYYVPDDRRITTDDWPFFYLEHNFIPGEYIITLLLIVVISAIMVFLANMNTRIGVDAHFFFLGAAFMLLETKSITSLAVLFGSTWIINSIVILFILIMALLANLYVFKIGEIKVHRMYLLLGGAIVVNFLIPLKFLYIDNLLLKIVLSGLLVASPIFFAGIIFANSFRKTQDPDYSIGSNILGGVIGGVLEYQSLVTGFHFLFLIIFLLYVISYLFILRK